ncbi:ABC transporter substrate-binding protein [Sphaerisporangium sp. TRM90804]|uniref:ABC transporter substrate-binding protein n=1 Tax=Sphaerisporangium sp. TRM90804 TaxID=3031113 RepID=UPI0024496DA1|nr:ABC transporter substrate-binding protein [Sphaerisporangium sp. TRM90804]MDH2424978.1 ABC transporter substrate-binding protein [Sphaerisporangium sp. TRM90804]
MHSGVAMEPGEIAEECGGEAVGAMFTRLVEYVPGTAATRNAVASSISTKDNKVFTVRLRKGWRFHDGTEVKARNFVKAWDYSAKKGQRGAGYFIHIAGSGEVTRSRGLSGLKVVGDHTFTVTLNKPYGGFVSQLGGLAFAPLPDSFFTNRAGYRKRPVGNGPYRFVSRSAGGEITVQRFDRYGGKVKPNVRKVVYRPFPDWDDAYDALVQGKVDFVPEVASTTGLGGRVLNRPYPGIHLLNFPMGDPKTAGNADFRKALSMAIPRDDVAEELGATRVAADSFIPPPTPGAGRATCGRFCRYDPAGARAALAKARAAGFKPPKEFALYYNADGMHEEWVEKVVDAVGKTLNGQVKVVAKPKATFADLLDLTATGKPKGMFRWAWVLDSLHMADVLATYRSGSPWNHGRYRSRSYDALLDAADRTPSRTKAASLYRAAEKVLVRDMPAIPLFFDRSIAGYSENVSNVTLTPLGTLDLLSVKTS